MYVYYFHSSNVIFIALPYNYKLYTLFFLQSCLDIRRNSALKNYHGFLFFFLYEGNPSTDSRWHYSIVNDAENSFIKRHLLRMISLNVSCSLIRWTCVLRLHILFLMQEIWRCFHQRQLLRVNRCYGIRI